MEFPVITNRAAFEPRLPTVTATAAAEPAQVNAFGIGRANQPEVELSPQARILQQNEQQQSERREAQPTDADSDAIAGTDYVRVSSSVGTTARNNLTSEQATEVYKSIQDLL